MDLATIASIDRVKHFSILQLVYQEAKTPTPPNSPNNTLIDMVWSDPMLDAGTQFNTARGGGTFVFRTYIDLSSFKWLLRPLYTSIHQNIDLEPL
jgi:hypothetical protein